MNYYYYIEFKTLLIKGNYSKTKQIQTFYLLTHTALLQIKLFTIM